MICTQACVVALAALVLLAACRMQRVTARGDVTVPGDPDRDAMAAALHWVSKAMILVVAALVAQARRFALHVSAAHAAALLLFDVAVVLALSDAAADAFFAPDAPRESFF